jgi:very-short-patch-repair endonuclease
MVFHRSHPRSPVDLFLHLSRTFLDAFRQPGVHLLPLAFRRQLRRESTDAERVLWQLVRGRQLGGFKFRRQYPVGPYVLDFYCAVARLAVELDGGQHFSAEGLAHDEVRARFLGACGIDVLRFPDNEVLCQRDDVLAELWRCLAAARPSPQPSPRVSGEREKNTHSDRDHKRRLRESGSPRSYFCTAV